MGILSNEDKEFLKTYNVKEYERPSVTVDMLIFTVDEGKLKLMLIQRKHPPYKNKWAIPGGFVNIDESILDAAKRELKEETGMSAYLQQFETFGDVGRDPRTRVISVAYLALVPPQNFKHCMKAGDDAKKAKLFDVELLENSSVIKKFTNIEVGNIYPKDLAFDHAHVIQQGLRNLQTQLKYNTSRIAFTLVNDEFTMYDFQQVYEAILGVKLLKANFRRSFERDYVKTGIVKLTGKYCNKYPHPAKLYTLKEV